MVWFVPDTRDETPAEAKAREREIKDTSLVRDHGLPSIVFMIQ